MVDLTGSKSLASSMYVLAANLLDHVVLTCSDPARKFRLMKMDSMICVRSWSVSNGERSVGRGRCLNHMIIHHLPVLHWLDGRQGRGMHEMSPLEGKEIATYWCKENSVPRPRLEHANRFLHIYYHWSSILLC